MLMHGAGRASRSLVLRAMHACLLCCRLQGIWTAGGENDLRALL